MTIDKIVRPNILQLVRYEVFNGDANSIKMHKNESPWEGISFMDELQLNRYPDPNAKELTEKVAHHFRTKEETIILSRGSDEAIDLILRVFCRPNKDGILIFPPTFSMYEIYGKINGLKIQAIPLVNDVFSLNLEKIVSKIQKMVKVIFICSPNNPTGNIIPKKDISFLCQQFTDKIIVVDEAYIDFSDSTSSLSLLPAYPNLIILRTLSKGFGMAGIRCGMTFASNDIISYLKKISAPYLLNCFSMFAAVKIFESDTQRIINKRMKLIKKERDTLSALLRKKSNILKVWPSETNFILVLHQYSQEFFEYCQEKNFLLRNFSHHPYLKSCLRITVGLPEENLKLLDLVDDFNNQVDGSYHAT